MGGTTRTARAFGHIAIGVEDIVASTRDLERQGVKIVRPAGPLNGYKNELIAFVEDADGYRIELIERKTGDDGATLVPT